MIASRHTTREKSSKLVIGLWTGFLLNVGAFTGGPSRADDPKSHLRSRDEPGLTRANDGDRSGPETGVITCPISGPANCQSPDQMRHGFSLIFLSVSDTNPQAGLITADTLQVAANGSISQVCWWGAYGDAAGTNDCGPGTGDAFTVTYYDNDLGQFPGSLRAGPFALSNVTKALTGASYGGQIMEWQFSGTHPAVSVTAGECLWIEIANHTTGSCLWLWAAAPPGDGFGAQDFDLDGYDFVDTVDYDLAWCVNVTVEPEACAPPGACGDPDAGNCLTARRTPFCSDMDCCTAVCESDTFCCSVAWDDICADAATPLSECGGCPHSLVLTDSGGDGWEGASLDVMVIGNLVLDGVALLAGQTMGTFTFNANDGDTISTIYHPGTANSENGYAIRDSVGQLIAQDLPPFAAGLQTTGVCVAINDACNDALGIVDGLTPFLTIGTTTDGPDYLGNPSCGGSDDQVFNDVWYEYNATCNGSLIVSTCEDLGAFATYDTRVSIHQGCAGAPGQCTTGPVLGCNDDDLDNDCGFNFQSTLVVPATAGTCYRIRVGGFSDLDEGLGELFVNCATCLTLADCADPNNDGIRDDPCMWWTCEAGDCLGTLRDPGQGNMGGSFGECSIDEVCEASDVFHALDCFSNITTLGLPGYPCEPNPPFALNVDAAGLFGSCALDGTCDANDVFAAQLCFSNLAPTGLPPYPCTCSGPGPGPQPPAPRGPAQPAPVDWTPISLTSPHAARPGELVEVDLFLDRALKDLRGYQLHVGVRGGATGQLQLVEMAIHSQRQDFAFRDQPYWNAFNVETAEMIAGLYSMGGPTTGRAYLATFTFRVSDDAGGTFVVDVLYDDQRAVPTERTFLFASPLQKIAVDGSHAACLAVTGRRKIGAR